MTIENYPGWGTDLDREIWFNNLRDNFVRLSALVGNQEVSEVMSGTSETSGITSSDITDSTATGRSVITAADAAAARTAIGAGTSSFSGSYTNLTNVPTNLVTTDTTQTISGAKTFSSGVRTAAGSTTSAAIGPSSSPDTGFTWDNDTVSTVLDGTTRFTVDNANVGASNGVSLAFNGNVANLDRGVNITSSFIGNATRPWTQVTANTFGGATAGSTTATSGSGTTLSGSNGTQILHHSGANTAMVSLNHAGSGTRFTNAFYHSGTFVGSITVQDSPNQTNFNTTSDHRLKENVADLTGCIDIVNRMSPKEYSFIDDSNSTMTQGLIAHELQTVVPQAVTGSHNEVDTDGNPVYQGVDYSKLVPHLIGAVQELSEEVNSLKARVEALENP